MHDACSAAFYRSVSLGKHVLAHADGYWKQTCIDHGLVGESLRREREGLGSYQLVATLLLQQQGRLKQLQCLQAFDIDIKQDMDDETQEFPYLMEPYCNEFILQYSCETVNPRITLLKKNGNSLRECGYVDDLSPEGVFRLHWSTTTAYKVLIRACNTSWVEFCVPSTESREPTVTVWRTQGDELEEASDCFQRYSMCEKCGLVVSVILSDDKVLEFNIFGFRKDPNVVDVSEVFHSLKNFLQRYQFYDVQYLCVFSDSGGGSDCHKHKLLVQFLAYPPILQFSLDTVQKSISGPENVYCPPFENRKDCVGMTSDFCMSSDRKLLAFISEQGDGELYESHVWNLESGAYTRVAVDLPFSEVELLAVGHLYQLLEIRNGGDIDIYLLSTGCNRVVQLSAGRYGGGRNASMDLLNGKDVTIQGDFRDMIFYPPMDQAWLNTLSCPAIGPRFNLVMQMRNNDFVVTRTFGV